MNNKEKLTSSIAMLLLAEDKELDFDNRSALEERYKFKKKEIGQALDRHGLHARKGAELFLEYPEIPAETRFCLKKLLQAKEEKEIQKSIDTFTETEYPHFFSIAQSAFDQGNYEEVEHLLSFMVTVYPAVAQIYILLACNAWHKEGIDSALQIYNVGLAAFYGDALFCHYAADCYEASGNIEKAKELWEKAVSIAGDEALRAEIEARLERLN